ncbi:phosphate transport system substrate-binding protein [Pseudochelatococcus lubricantis]|uniref:Phosphate-binding protein PstS n=1 Tax=Pseudochelatococcus lubricantis TaxID=1538102 RepID=A0ABX0V628_9HYPH|nr:phosphate ABC transporter substrate-binding protein PstS [Pseudochelatococcus lubricantis]NIJ59559.1 phosphate transport system substrate-binding protein [Pseudochelatococcus lubricantis]
MERAGLDRTLPLAALAMFVCLAEGAKAVELNGAGATFPANLYKEWIETFNRANADITVTYDAVGSGEGIRRFTQGTVAFGATERPMSEKEVASVAEGVLHVPTTAGMVVLAYNIPGFTGDLRLSRQALVGVLSGQITRWDDPLIRAANPDANLPERNIALVARRDSSGTTFSLTNHLAKVSDTWKEVGTSIAWPANAQIVSGSEAVAGRIAIAEYSIGYVEYSFAARLNLRSALVENKAGQFIRADGSSGAAALASALDAMPEDGRQLIPDPAGDAVYPIVSYSWVLLRKANKDQQVAAGLKRFVGWGLTDGQSFADKLGYIPLPAPVVTRAQAILGTLN